MAKKCKVCNQSYADDLEACPHCAEAAAAAALDDEFEVTQSPAAAGDEPDVDLSELFGEESAEEKTPKAPPPAKQPRGPRTMSAVNLDDDADVDLGQEDPEKSPGPRTKTQLISAKEMEAVARGESADDEASILDTSAGLDVGTDASAVDLGADDNLNSEASLGSGAFPTPTEIPLVEAEGAAEEELPVVEQAAEDEELPVVETPAEDDEAPSRNPRRFRSGRSWVYGRPAWSWAARPASA